VEPDQLLTLREAAAVSGKKYDALRAAARRGRLPARLMPFGRGGGYYVTTTDALARYVAEVEAYRADSRPRSRRPIAKHNRITAAEAAALVPEE
jgi:hypothetical protein